MRSRLVLAALALVPAAALLVAPSPASATAGAAAPQSFDVGFPVARLQLGDGVVDRSVPTTSTTLNGTYDDMTGAVVVPQNAAGIARFDLDGTPFIVQPNEAFTGSHDPATGALALGANANIVLPTSQTGGCVFPGVELDFSTTNVSASGDLRGAPFTDGLGTAATTGSLVAAFASLPTAQTYGNGDSSRCATFMSQFSGPGALQVGYALTPEPDPTLGIDARPARATLRQGSTATVRARVSAVDAADPLQATVCATLPRGTRGPRLVGPRCIEAGDVSTGPAGVRFTVRATARTRVRTYPMRLTATADGVAPDTDRVVVDVRRKRR